MRQQQIFLRIIRCTIRLWSGYYRSMQRRQHSQGGYRFHDNFKSIDYSVDYLRFRVAWNPLNLLGKSLLQQRTLTYVFQGSNPCSPARTSAETLRFSVVIEKEVR